MSTYKKTGPGGFDYAVPSSKPPKPAEPQYNPYCYVYPDVEPVPTPDIPGRKPPVAPPPPYPYPEKIDASSKKLSKLSQKSKVLVQMINDFQKKNKPAILTVGKNSYQFGTNVTIVNGESEDGMYSDVVCANEAPDLTESTDYTVEDDGTVVLESGAAVDLLQTELKRVQLEIAQVAALLSDEISDDTTTVSGVIGID